MRNRNLHPTVARLHEKYPHVCASRKQAGDRRRFRKPYVPSGKTLSPCRATTDSPSLHGLRGKGCDQRGIKPHSIRCRRFSSLALSGDYEQARRIHLEHYRLFNDLFCEPNPVPVKTLMETKGLISSSQVRLPLTPPSRQNLELLSKIAESLNL